MTQSLLKSVKRGVIFLSAVMALLIHFPVLAKDTLVASKSEFSKAVESALPGDVIILANGEWQDFEMVFAGEGTAEKPISLTAETKGKVIISGRSSLSLSGKHLIVSGLVFKDGHSPTRSVIAFRTDEETPAYHSRVTEVVIDGFNKPERYSQDSWVNFYGKHNRLDHSYIAGKSNRGVTIGVQLLSREGTGKENLENYHRIDHNYFGPRPVLGSNGGETIRIGNSWTSLHNSFTVVENNFFDRCDGEVEIISNKSGSNTFRGNVFYESRGTLTLRHGNNNVVENNIFLGNHVPHTGGIRVINKNQIVRNNYMFGLTGHRFGGGFVVMNGIYNSPINRYHQVDNALIENNSLIDVDYIELAAGSDEERSAPPINSVFRNNLIFNIDGKDNIRKHDDISGITFENNSIRQEVTLEKAANGLLYPVEANLASVGASKDLSVLDKNDVGPDWYQKPGKTEKFSGGISHVVMPGVNTLVKAISQVGAGDTLLLAPGKYIVSKAIDIDKPVTIQGNKKVRISFERSHLFKIVEGGSLKLDGVLITGESAPKLKGNAVVKTHAESIVSNFDLVIENSTVEKLSGAEDFSFFKAGKHTFADAISINNTRFVDISGSVLEMNRELEKSGRYNGEYITITDSHFENIAVSVADILRCCKDESTFGPHFTLTSSNIISVGVHEKIASEASIRLFGNQVVTIIDNDFKSSKPILITETVGEPVHTLEGNRYVKTLKPTLQSIVGE